MVFVELVMVGEYFCNIFVIFIVDEDCEVLCVCLII